MKSMTSLMGIVMSKNITPPHLDTGVAMTKSEVLAARRNSIMGGCCDRFADQQACDCLERADDDISPGGLVLTVHEAINLSLLEGKTFQAHVVSENKLRLIPVTIETDMQCPVIVGGERCGGRAGHNGKHCWGGGHWPAT